MRELASTLLLALIVGPLTGCVTYWRGQEMEADLKAQQAQIERANAENAELRRLLDELASRVGALEDAKE